MLGFSQGGALAALVAAALEGGASSSSSPPRAPPGPGPEWAWVAALRVANGGRPLRFAAVYSGFWGPPPDLGWLYDPPIRTPTLHFLGSLDTVVDEERSQALVERCVDPIVLVHPGGHYVPVSKDWVMPLSGFIKKCLEEESGGTGS